MLENTHMLHYDQMKNMSAFKGDTKYDNRTYLHATRLCLFRQRIVVLTRCDSVRFDTW